MVRQFPAPHTPAVTISALIAARTSRRWFILRSLFIGTIAGEDPRFGHGPSKKNYRCLLSSRAIRTARYQRPQRRVTMPEEHRKSDEALKVLIKSRWAVIRVEGGGREIAWGALGCLTA